MPPPKPAAPAPPQGQPAPQTGCARRRSEAGCAYRAWDAETAGARHTCRGRRAAAQAAGTATQAGPALQGARAAGASGQGPRTAAQASGSRRQGAAAETGPALEAGRAPGPRSRRPGPKHRRTARATRSVKALVNLGIIEDDQAEDISKESQETGSRRSWSRSRAASSPTIRPSRPSPRSTASRSPTSTEKDQAPTGGPQARQRDDGQLYKMLPLAYQGRHPHWSSSADPTNIGALDDLRNLLGIKQIQTCIASQRAIEAAIPPRPTRARKRASLTSSSEIEADRGTGAARPQRETSIDLGEAH